MALTQEDTHIERAYYVGTQRHGWRPGKPLLILGVVYVTTRGFDPCPSFKVRDPEDGAEDIIPIYGHSSHKIISESDVKDRQIPKIIDDNDDFDKPVFGVFDD